MFFNVAQLLRDPTGSERVYPIEGKVPDVADGMAPACVQGAVRLVRTHRGILAYTRIHGIAYAECSRCLGVASVPVDLTLEDEFLPTVDVHTGAPLNAPVEGSTFWIDDHHHLDMTEAIRQGVVMEEPMQPLCREACAGLCDRCGADLNVGTCACPAPIDARWSALAAIADDGVRPSISAM